MKRRRYKIAITDENAVSRRFSISLRVAVCSAFAILTLPVLIGLGARWSATSAIDELRLTNSLLQAENLNYRSATGDLTTQIQSLERVINDLGARAAIDPADVRAMQKLPAIVKSGMAGGTSPSVSAIASVVPAALTTPEDTFGVLRDLLGGLETRLLSVRKVVEKRQALAAATPSIWPARGWLTGWFGGRSDPFTGEAGFHSGLDISTEKGQPVYATADGRVESAAYSGDYGNLVILTHGFGLQTRYGHLSSFAVTPGQSVARGQVIGHVGATGRATGPHLHYEVLANGQLLNPLQLLTQPADR